MKALSPIPIEAIRKAHVSLKPYIVRTPLLPCKSSDHDTQIYLKPENLQPIGSFKIRGAGNAINLISSDKLKKGVYTASAGNMAQGVAWWARKQKIPCVVFVPDHAPKTKLKAIEQLGARYIKLPFAEWWQVLVDHGHPEMKGHFIHPVSNPDVIAGNGTIGLEIFEDLPDVDSIVVPFGGGGLGCGIASAVKSLNPKIKIYASEVRTAHPLYEAFNHGKPVKVNYSPSFVDGIGSSFVLQEMWPLVNTLIDGSIVISLEDIAKAIKMLITDNRIVAEGAGASSLAAALSGKPEGKKIVCIISGGNIDESKITTILQGKIPE